MNNRITKKLKEVIINHSRKLILAEDIHDHSDLINDLGYDSILLMELIIDIEKEFGFTFDNDDFQFDTITKFGKLIENISKYIN